MTDLQHVSQPPRHTGVLIAIVIGTVLVLVGVTAGVALSMRDSDSPAAATPVGAPSAPGIAKPAEWAEPPVDLMTANSQADLNVTVVAQQWSWIFNYTKGSSQERATVWETGTTDQRPTLWLVQDKSVTFDLYSPDVIHSFWTADFLFKMDVVPGRAATNYFTLTPTEAGRFTGRCAELCGTHHSRMMFDVTVVSQAEFDAHLAELEAAGNTGINAPGNYAEEINGS